MRVCVHVLHTCIYLCRNTHTHTHAYICAQLTHTHAYIYVVIVNTCLHKIYMCCYPSAGKIEAKVL